MKIKCQQNDIFKIRDGISGHGEQEVKSVFAFRIEPNKKWVDLGCGCNIPLDWLPTQEQKAINEVWHF